ncbi:WXG100 family type VII secretion target [Streptomyces smyrnaeus]|uniref:WXG100 family type VII secretion target n=1 Tax=Streptomyces smyrnaeus TaxID=1387713 RepID=UPI0033B4EE6A
MSKGQEIDDATLISLKKELGEMFASVQSRANQLKTMIDNLEGHWKGIGRGAFDTVQNGIQIDMNDLKKILDGFVGSIDDTLGLKGRNEDDIVQRMKKLQQGVGANSTGPDTTHGSLASDGNYGSKLSQL